MIPPERVHPFAEDTGLIRPLTEDVLETALRNWSLLARRGLELDLAVNLSTRRPARLAPRRARSSAAARVGVPAGAAQLEITESTIMADSRRRDRTCSSGCAPLGVRLAIDDFGTGYSSLAYLKRCRSTR